MGRINYILCPELLRSTSGRKRINRKDELSDLLVVYERVRRETRDHMGEAENVQGLLL